MWNRIRCQLLLCLHQDALESHRRLITAKLPLKRLIRGKEITLYRALTLHAIYYKGERRKDVVLAI